MTPQPIDINGQHGEVIYLDYQWHPVEKDAATMAKVRFDDGRIVFFQVRALATS